MDDEETVEVITEEDITSTPQDYEYKYECEQEQYEFKNNVWDQEMTFSLIDEYRNHLQDFLHPQGQMIRDIWEDISHNMRMRGYDLTPAACDNKWRQLKKTFRYNMPNGGRKSLSKWIYYEALEDILGNREIARRLIWKQRSTIKREAESPYYPEEKRLDDKFVEETNQEPVPAKKVKVDEPPKWFENFLTEYQEEEKQKRKMLQKMHTELATLERQKCVLLENLIKKLSKTEPVPKIVDAVSLSQEVFEDEL